MLSREQHPTGGTREASEQPGLQLGVELVGARRSRNGQHVEPQRDVPAVGPIGAVVTEWRDGSLPVEIELVAAAPGASQGDERLTLVEPISARYSRIARIFAGRPVFVSGLTGSPAEPAAQVRDLFARMRDIVVEAGSDMRHLAKATYYVSDKTADQEINTIRPSIFDNNRPPAASKISVQGTGHADKRVVIDMVAVTTRDE